MTIQEVSDAELSKWIADKVEPFASLPEPTEPLILGESGRHSRLKCWLERSDYETGDEPYWANRDMVNDPAMTVMLLEKARLILRPTDNGWTAFNEPRNTATAETPGRAVAEAFALANGFKE